jgi:hypothetical protein
MTGCGGTQPAPAAAAKTRPAPSAKRPAKSAVFFTVAFEALLPVACFDAKAAQWLTGEKCYGLLPSTDMTSPSGSKASVKLESGRVAKVGGWRIPTITGCTLTTPLLMFENAAQETPGSYAMWPEDAGERVHRITWESTKKGAEALDAPTRTRLGEATQKVIPTKMVSVVQVASADLDGDEHSELLYSVNAGSFDPVARKGASILFHGHLDEPPVMVRSSDHSVFRVEGTVDLNDDGLGEVWISERTFHPNGLRTDGMALLRFDGPSLVPLPPMESCWPPAKAK